MYTNSDLTAEDTYSDWISPITSGQYPERLGYLDVAITGTWSGTLTLQKRHAHHTSGVLSYTGPYDVEQFTGNVCKVIIDKSETVEYRIGFKAGDFVSGTASVALEQ